MGVNSIMQAYFCLQKLFIQHLLRQKRGAKCIAMLAVCLAFVRFSLDLSAQEPRTGQPPQYRMIQVVDSDVYIGKINEASRQGYRLAATGVGANGSLSAIMEIAQQPGQSYEYLLLTPNPKPPFSAKSKADLLEQLNAAGAKGFRVHIPSAITPALLIMESVSDQQTRFEYGLVISGGLSGSFSNDEIARLLDAGYHWTDPCGLISGPTALIFERGKKPDSVAGAPAQQPAASVQQRFRFLIDRSQGWSFPEGQLEKASAEGWQAVNFFDVGSRRMLLVAESMPPSTAYYEYKLLKPAKQPTSYSLRQFSALDPHDLTQAGQQGFRMLRLREPTPPFAMEKAPGTAAQYEYRFLLSSTLSELTGQLADAGQAGFHVAQMQALQDGFFVVMEKSDAAKP